MRVSRRHVLKASISIAVAGEGWVLPQVARAQSVAGARTLTAQTPVLTIAFEEHGDASGFPVILLHGFPDDVRAWDAVVPPLAQQGYRVIVPYLRGHGATRFREASALRTGQQAAMGQDVIDLADALRLERFAVAGFDWGNRAACIAAALHPSRVRAAALIHGYTIQNTFAPPRPASPERERALWYQWYFNTERGRAGLERDRRGICRLLWKTWSPTWRFTDAVFDRTAVSFDNPDFVDVVVHSYRHRNANAAGEPRYEEIERRLAQRPKIEVPSIVLHGASDGVAGAPPDEAAERAMLSSFKGRRVVRGAGHFLPREKPDVVSSALLELLVATR